MMSKQRAALNPHPFEFQKLGNEMPGMSGVWAGRGMVIAFVIAVTWAEERFVSPLRGSTRLK
ncbi:MAG: hypothetical protein NTY98_24780 [Verrucomicrobia bacterium]|nr:hypothetical protein [Verrucomicrobiota bacterium]